MYWDGFCAFLPDISGLWGGGGPNPARISKFGGGGEKMEKRLILGLGLFLGS